MDSRQGGAGVKPTEARSGESCQYPQGLPLAGGRNSVPSSPVPNRPKGSDEMEEVKDLGLTGSSG